MTYQLQRLAPGSYDLVLDGTVVGSVVRNVRRNGNYHGWRAELLDGRVGAERPAPFTEAEHEFASLIKLLEWLGSPIIVDAMSND